MFLAALGMLATTIIQGDALGENPVQMIRGKVNCFAFYELRQ